MVLSDDGFSGSFSQRIDMKIHVCVYVYAHCVYIYIYRERLFIQMCVCVKSIHTYCAKIICILTCVKRLFIQMCIGVKSIHTNMFKGCIHTDVCVCL